MRFIAKVRESIPTSMKRNVFINSVVGTMCLANRSFATECNDAICENPELENRKSIKYDMAREFVRSGASPKEYCRYGFENKSNKQRDGYYLDWDRFRRFSCSTWNKFPRDKFQRYCLFSEYYKRGVLKLTNACPEEEELYSEFVSRNSFFIAKPVNGRQGVGVKKIKSSEAPNLEQLYAITNGSCLIEEIIEQGEEIARFHRKSVNTVRYVTCINEQGKYGCLFAMLRVGRGDSIVDNVGSGGIICLIDQDKGVIVSDGLCGYEWFEKHPDSLIFFKGAVIPEWRSLCMIAEEAHKKMPEQRMIGWDFAWSTKGWDIVEANPSPSFQSVQVLKKQGIRKELEDFYGVKM